jgi:hypothetical protein
MTKSIFKLFSVFVLTLVSVQIYGLAAPLLVRADIPFAFTVEGKTLPAGQYTIERVWSTNPDLLVIRGLNNHSQAIVISETVQKLQASNDTELVFDKIGSHYFLKDIWTVGENLGREIREAKAEKEVKSAGLVPTRVSVLARG